MIIATTRLVSKAIVDFRIENDAKIQNHQKTRFYEKLKYICCDDITFTKWTKQQAFANNWVKISEFRNYFIEFTKYNTDTKQLCWRFNWNWSGLTKIGNLFEMVYTMQHIRSVCLLWGLYQLFQAYSVCVNFCMR